MAIIKPFRALRPKPDLAKLVAARPYDVLNSEEARVEANGNPYSFLHVTKSEIDLPADTDPHSSAVYQTANRNLHKFISDGALFHEHRPCYYIYELTRNGKTQSGLVCLSSVDDYFNDAIKKHEFTRPEKEKDRIDHMLAIKAQTGNVLMAYRDIKEINELISSWKQNHEPVYNFTADDEVRHAVWIIDKGETIDSMTKLFNDKVANTYIADGHHRAASAAKVSQQLKTDEANYFLTTIFPASELAILDYNRLVKDLNGLSVEQFLKELEREFIVEKSTVPLSPGQAHQFGMYVDRQWYKLTAKSGTYTNDPIGVLDVTILSNNILNKILAIQDQRTDTRIDFVGGIRGLSELEKRVDSGEMKTAFSLHPVSIDQLLNIADSGNVMPPKSTWFEPKLRDGLLTHTIGS